MSETLAHALEVFKASRPGNQSQKRETKKIARDKKEVDGMIKVTNNASQKIRVSINKWGDSGDTTYFSINQGESGKWSRSDDRGFVMMVKKGGATEPYYVQHDSEIVVHSNRVTDNGSVITSIA